MKLTIIMNLDNDAFVGADGEVYLTEVKGSIDKAFRSIPPQSNVLDIEWLSDTKIKDYNGNTVGTMIIVKEDK